MAGCVWGRPADPRPHSEGERRSVQGDRRDAAKLSVSLFMVVPDGVVDDSRATRIKRAPKNVTPSYETIADWRRARILSATAPKIKGIQRVDRRAVYRSGLSRPCQLCAY